MSKVKWLALLAAVMALGLTGGCGGGDDDGDGGGGGSADSYAGTWTGKVCGRDLTLNLTQNGTSLTGDYTLSGVGDNEDFHEPIGSGTVSSLEPPATATLTGFGGRKFEITVTSYNSLGGTFYKGGQFLPGGGGRRAPKGGITL